MGNCRLRSGDRLRRCGAGSAGGIISAIEQVVAAGRPPAPSVVLNPALAAGRRCLSQQRGFTDPNATEAADDRMSGERYLRRRTGGRGVTRAERNVTSSPSGRTALY